MPTHLELLAEPRGVFGKHVRRLRRQGIVPANIYGHGDPRAIQAPARAMEYLLAHGGRTGVVTIAVQDRSEIALLKDIQRDPRSGQILHIDLAFPLNAPPNIDNVQLIVETKASF